ncbi:hypothetical protein KL86SPO_31180 [uncultured Sporomusa sp.]|uniref:Uncharacterized protein n=1 Tax=uncultured Sporomusa sp. TaxID=307249 RepID=A0A212LU32_9FIRM|nr:hypothetical protein KL86SPO_31180 [uncultured Sporomusa sp.]
MYSYYSTLEKSIVDDLMDYLGKLGLRDYSGISLPEISLSLAFNSPNGIFYASKIASVESNRYFSLDDIELNYDQFIFYKGEL